jgi:hypothetical protein
MTRLEDQVRELAGARPLRRPLPIEDLARRSSQIARRRKRGFTALVALILIGALLCRHSAVSVGRRLAQHGCVTLAQHRWCSRWPVPGLSAPGAQGVVVGPRVR